jgi:hypothetical protein
MTACRYIDAFGKPATPLPDDFCRNCRGRRHASDGTHCADCTGTGWQGLRFAPSPAPEYVE